MSARGALRVAGIVAGVAAGTAAVVTGALLAPRRGDERIDARWAELRRYRYAHRGLHSADAPENSLRAFRHARDLGFGVELDVHLTLDGRLVVFHDYETTRVCGRPGIVEEMTLSELGEHRLLGTEEAPPALGSVLRLFELGTPVGGSDEPDPAPVIIELKTLGGNYATLCSRLMDCLDSYDVRFCVESFDPRVLTWLRENRPDVVRGLVIENPPRHLGEGTMQTPRIAETLLRGNSACRPDFLSCRFEDRGNLAVRLSCGILGCHLVTWTVGCERDLLASEAGGAPAIFEGFVPGARPAVVR